MPSFFGQTAGGQMGVPNVARSLPVVRGFQDGTAPSFEYPYAVSGITLDAATGAVLGGCTVYLYRTADDTIVSSVVSDATTGYFTIPASKEFAHYIRAYKTGAPDSSGASVNTLVGT